MSAPTVTAATAAPPGGGARRGRRVGMRWRLAAVVAVVLAGVGLLAASGLQGTLVYYRTPTELVTNPALGAERVRLGGLVLPGSVQRAPGVVRFTLSDGANDVRVAYTGPLVGVFQAGQGALVDGTYGADRVFRADALMVKHNNTYRGPDGKTYTPPTGSATSPGATAGKGSP